jgi:Domain of unknown function (DUF4249)
MAHNILRISIYMFAVIGITSCETDSDLVIDALPRSIVVQGVLDEDKPMRVKLSYSHPVTGTGTTTFISDATVAIHDTKGNVFPLTFVDENAENGNDNLVYYVGAADAKPVAGEQYQLTATAPGVPVATTTATIPHAPALLDVRFASRSLEVIKRKDENFYLGFAPIHVQFRDEPGVNYYEIAVLQERAYSRPDGSLQTAWYETNVYSYNETLNSRDINDDGSKSTFRPLANLIFSDETFNGREIGFDVLAELSSVRLGPSSAYPVMGKYMVELRHVSRDYFLYKRSLTKFIEVGESPFSEPVQVFSNVNDGFGILAGYAKSKALIDARDSGSF